MSINLEKLEVSGNISLVNPAYVALMSPLKMTHGGVETCFANLEARLVVLAQLSCDPSLQEMVPQDGGGKQHNAKHMFKSKSPPLVCYETQLPDA